MSSNIPQPSGIRKPTKWTDLEEKYKQDIEALTESAEMATIDKELAEEKLDSCEKELQEVKQNLTEALQRIEALESGATTSEQPVGDGGNANESTVTMMQLQKVEEQNEVLKQALIKVRDISSKDKKEVEDLRIECEELHIKLLDAEEKEHKYTEQIKVLEEQVDVSQSAQEMVEKLTQQKAELEDKLRDMIEDMDSMEKLRDLNEQLLESARENEMELTNQIDLLRVKCVELTKGKRDIEDYLTDQERGIAKLKEENRVLNDTVATLRDQFKNSESIEQQKHQIENVAYKLNFSESKMAEKEAEIARCRRNLAELEEQMNNMSSITKEQSARLDDLKLQYEAKVSENAELQRALKKKMEEVSELEIRRDMAEKKLQSVQKDRELKVTELTRKIETMKGLEVQHEEDMKRLLEDNELIERERRELRDQLNKSNRSLERSLQTAGNISMVTAQDTSLASLGISFHSTPSVQASPIHPIQPQPALSQAQQQQQSLVGAQASAAAAAAASTSMASGAPRLQQQQQQALKSGTASPSEIGHTLVPQSSIGSAPLTLGTAPVPAARRQLFASAEVAATADNGFLFGKIEELSVAFDQMTRKNYELELELAYRELENRPPPYSGCSSALNVNDGFAHQHHHFGATNLAALYDIDRARSLRLEMNRLKREIRAAMINQQICTKSRNITSHMREQRFNISKLALRCQALECEASNLLSNSSLTGQASRIQIDMQGAGAMPMLQSTPVK